MTRFDDLSDEKFNNTVSERKVANKLMEKISLAQYLQVIQMIATRVVSVVLQHSPKVLSDQNMSISTVVKAFNNTLPDGWEGDILLRLNEATVGNVSKADIIQIVLSNC